MAIGTQLPEIEKAVIFYGLANNISAPDIYKMLHPGAKEESAKTLGYNWLRTAKRSAYVETVKTRLAQFVKFEKRVRENNGLKLNPDESEEYERKIDYTNKAEFIQYLNDAANRITDDKLKNDILKMLSDHLDFKDENKRDEASKVQRFYMPLRCQDCVLYQQSASSEE